MTSPDLERAARLPWDAADPYPYYERRRREGDVVWDDTAGAWLVLGYHTARQILTGAGWTSNPLDRNAPGIFRTTDPEIMRRNMVFNDGADHLRIRHALRDVFTRNFIAKLGEGIEAIAAETMDPIPAGVEFDLMTDIALPLPFAVAATWLALDADSARLLRDESPAINRMLNDYGDITARENGTAGLATLLTALLPLAADRRTHPGDDLLSFIAADPNLELDDVVMAALIIAIAGHEATATFLGAAMVRLLTPTSDGVRPIDSIGTIDDRMITELLRLDGPVQIVRRTATHDHVINDITIHAGEPALLVIAAANRDPAIFNAPDQFQPDRAGPAPLAFGYGAHFCLGAALARLQVAIALRRLLRRRVTVCGLPTWRDTTHLRGPRTLPCVFAGG
jgi:cytochrome P450